MEVEGRGAAELRDKWSDHSTMGLLTFGGSDSDGFFASLGPCLLHLCCCCSFAVVSGFLFRLRCRWLMLSFSRATS